MIDPPRKEVPQAVARCKKAGIRVIMATGDHKITARAIAKEVGILESHGKVITGSELEKMNDEALQEALKTNSVFARVAPEHKHRMVQTLQDLGYVVAMTGDGVNDAPALQAAEIGIAMGITGTDVTKETAEMVLTDDNFASIVNAIEEGRVVFKNVRKVVKFLLATNIGEDLTLLSSLVLFTAQGLTISPVQILWVNLVTDGILDITLAMEPKEEEVMEEGPRRRGSRIVNKEILFNIFIVALVMATGTLFMYGRASNMNNASAQTVGFTTLAMFQVFNALNCRSRTRSIFQMGFFKNPYLIMAIAASIILQVGAIYLPFMQKALGTTPLTIQDWGWIILVSSSVLFVDEIRKLIQRKFFNNARQSG
jgi:P-type Ca2+ transporter type 2C